MRETKRAFRTEPPDDAASARMAEILRRADALLAEWSQFGAAVRTQVEREASQIGNAVVDATDLAVRRAAAEGTSRAISEQFGKQLAALSAEVGKLETRARAAARVIGEQQRGDRTLLYGLAAGMLVAIGLLVALLVREPAAAVIAEPVASPIASPPLAPAPTPVVTPPADPPAEDLDLDNKAEPAPMPTSAPVNKAVPPKDKTIKLGPPVGAKAPISRRP